MKILHLDTNHKLLINQLDDLGFINDEDYTSSKQEIEAKIHNYDGFIIRSRFKIDKHFLDKATNLKFIGRVGAGLENIDLDFCNKQNIQVFRSPEGNMDAVGEHVIGSLLMLFNNLKRADDEVRKGIWLREENRGFEIKGKTFAIIGYGYMGESLAKKLSGFGANVIAYDKYKTNFECDYTKEVSLQEVFETADIVSLHTPLTKETVGMINNHWLSNFQKSIYFINTARGQSVITKDLITHLDSGKIKGACLDVYGFETSSFQSANTNDPDFDYLSKSTKVILSPHIAGWTFEAKEKMANVLINKILFHF